MNVAGVDLEMVDVAISDLCFGNFFVFSLLALSTIHQKDFSHDPRCFVFPAVWHFRLLLKRGVPFERSHEK